MPLTYFPGVAGPVTRPLTASTAAPPAGAPVPGLLLPGNMLSLADSDFEAALTGDWAGTNCALAQSPAFAFDGQFSLAVTASSTGTVKVQLNSPYLPGVPLAGYTVSGYCYSPYAGITAQCGYTWRNSGGSSISTSLSAALAMTQGAWTPLQAAASSPAATAHLQPVFQILGMTGGQTVYLDLLYAAVPLAQVLIAWQSQPGAAAPLFADMTPFTRGDPAISITRGRQDNISDVQPGALSFTLANDLGWFTEGKTGSPFYPSIKIGRRIQVNLHDETGTWHTRFDGQLNSNQLNPAPTGLTADAAIDAADVIAYLNRQDTLSAWTKQEILLDTPALHWTLDDVSGSSVATETSGNNGPALQLREFGTAGTYQFAGGTPSTSGVNNGMETQTWTPGPGTPAPFPSVYFKQSAAGAPKTSQGNWQLQAPISPIGTGAGQNPAMEGFLIPDPPNNSLYTSATNFTFYAFSLASTRNGAMMAVVVSGGASPLLQAIVFANFLQGGIGVYSITAGTAWHGSTAGPVGCALAVAGSNSAPTATFYVNGVSQGTVNLPPGTVFNLVTAGGPLGGYEGWLGQLACLSVFATSPGASRFAAHAVRAQSGAYGQKAGDVINAVAGYAGIPSFWNNIPGETNTGLSFLDYFNLQGQNALAAMQQAEAVDGGLLYADAAGRLNYAGRESRMGAGAPVLTLQAGQYEADLGYKVNDQYLCNEAGLSSAGITTGVAAVNTGSQADYGPYPNGTAAAPNSGPYLTYNSWYQSYLNGTGGIVGAFAADNLAFAAQWTANSRAQPAPKGATIRIDMATLPASGPDGIAPSVLYGLEIGSVIGLAGLPAQFPDGFHANEYFVEGVSETLGVSDSGLTHELTLYTSPASQGRAWIAGDPVYGLLDSTALVGRSSPASPATVPGYEFAGATYPGPPYYPPSYSSAMNKTGFVGDLDQAGIWANLQQQMQPPMCVMAVAQSPQSISSSIGQPGTRLAWDTVYADTLGGNGWLAGFPNWYFVLVPGWWQLYGVANYATNGTGRRAAWFLVCQQAAKGGTGPVAANGNVIGTRDVIACSGFPTGVGISAKIYCTLGTAIAVQTWQNSGGALNTAVTRGGCMFAARFLGDTAVQD